MFNPSYLQEPQNYPTGAEGGIPQPQGASPLLYPTAAETQPKLKARLKPNEALALAEVNRPRRKSPDEMRDELAVGMFDPSKTPLPQDLWGEATQRRSKMIQEGRLPMEFGEIDSLADGLVWTKDAAYGAASYIAGTLGGAAAAVATNPAATARQLPATIGSAAQRTATEFGLQTYQDIFNLTHEPKYRVKETGEFVAVNKTGLPLVMPAASGGNNVLSGDGIIDPRMPEQGIRSFAEQGKTLVPVTEQDLKDYRYGQYLDRMAMGAQSLEAQNFQVPSNLAQQVLATSAVTAPLAAFLAATDPGGTVGPNQAQAEVAVLAAQSAVPMGAASRSWGISRRVAGGLSKVAGAAEGTAGFFPDVETALRAKFVKAVTSGTNLDAGAQKTVLQSAIDGGKTLGIASGAYAAATGLSAIEGVPGELKQAAWTAANLYSGYKGGMFVARQLRSASGFAKTVLKEVADPAQGLDVGARMRVAANPDVPDFVRNVLRSPSSFRAMESTPARLAKNQALSPAARAVFGKLSDYRFVQAARLAKDTAAGVPKGMAANVPFVAGAMASDDPERAGQMLAAGGVFGALGGAAGRFTEARQRSVERAEGDIARLLVDIQAGNELGSGLGGDIMRNRLRPGTQFQDGPGGFVLNPDREVSAFLTEVEMAGGDVSAFVRGKSFDELAQWAAYQGFFRDKVDLVPLNATDFKLNAEANGQNGAGAYFLQPSEGRRARVFVNAESRRNGLAPHEYGHAVLRGGALSPDQIDAVHAEINARYAPDALRNMAGEYAATMVRAENAKQGINIEPSPAAITAKVNELSQGSMIKGSADGLDWLREEIFAEEFRNANIDMNRARRNIPLGANPVSFFENLLSAQSRALHMAGIDIDPQTGKPMGRDQIFKENRVAAGDPVVMKNYEDYVKQWKRWINDPTHEVDPGAPLSKTGNPQDTANSPNVTWKDYGRGRMETEFAVKNPDGTVTPKDWKRDIKPTVRARQQAVREMSNRSKEVAAADDQTFGMRRRRDGRLETSGRRLPDSFFFIPQYKPFHDILRKINAADDIGETLQVRFFAKGKSKDVFKDGIKNTSAVNREALHGNFVAKKDGTLMWGWLDMTQFRNRAMKAIADKNPALAQYDWNLKAIMDDLPVHLTDQRRGKGGAFSVGPERANILNGLIGIGDGPLVGAFGKGTAYKTIHLDSIDAVVPTGKTGGEFDVYRANRNAMPDDPKPPVDMETDIDNNRMPQQIPREAQGMPDAVDALTTDQLQRQYEENQGYLGLSTLGMREGRPVRGGAAQTRELLRRNEAISAELERRGVRSEDAQLQRALQRRGQAMPDVVAENFTAAQEATGGTLRPIADQPENAPVIGRISPEQSAAIDELSAYYSKETPQRIKRLQADAVDSLSSRLINKGIPVSESKALAAEVYRLLKDRSKGSLQVISGMGTSDLSRMAGTGRPTVKSRDGVNPNWLTSAFEAFDSDNDLALMKAQQVARQLNKEQQGKVAAGQNIDEARASGVRAATIDQGMSFVIGEKTADQKAFGSSLREDPSAPPRVYASVVEGQKYGAQGNYNVFFEWKKDTPMVATSHHHYGVGNGLTDIHASANVGDKNARSFGDPTKEIYDTLPSGKRVLKTDLLVGNAGLPFIRAHQLAVSLPDSALSSMRSIYKEKGIAGVRNELRKVAVSQLVGSASQGKTQSFTSSDKVPPMVAIQRNRTEAYVLNPDLRNVGRITIVSNSAKETALIKKNLAAAFKNNGSAMPPIKVVGAETGPSGNRGRSKITDEFFDLTGKVVYGVTAAGAAAMATEEL
jgi:hypothetical protein